MNPYPEQPPLRLAVLTTAPLRPARRVFFERLCGEPSIALRLIVVLQDPPGPATRLRRFWAGIRRGGGGWLWFRLSQAVRSVVLRVARWLFERFHKPRSQPEGYEQLADHLGVKVVRATRSDSPELVELLRAERLSWSVLLEDSVPSLPAAELTELGALRLRTDEVAALRARQSAGANSSGDEQALSVLVEQLLPRAPGPCVVAAATVNVEECDTLASLQIKSDIRGSELCLQAIARLAQGPFERDVVAGKCAPTTTLSDYDQHLAERGPAAQARRTMPTMSPRGFLQRAQRVRVLLQYILLLPLLAWRRQVLLRQRRAPIWMVFYHLVANRALNHMAIPLERFAQEIELIRRYYPIIPIQEAIGRLRSGHNREIAVVLTFDDGYRANQWALEFLRFHHIPACFFVSAGHVQDGTPFQHDLARGWTDAKPWTGEELAEIARTNHMVRVESHAVHHEDFGQLDGTQARECLVQSKALLHDMTGREPVYFSFPFGLKGVNINQASCAVACELFDAVFSAYGGYNLPGAEQRQHFLRFPNPEDTLELLCYLSGYTGLGPVLKGDGWSVRTHDQPPFTPEVTSSPHLSLESRRLGLAQCREVEHAQPSD